MSEELDDKCLLNSGRKTPLTEDQRHLACSGYTTTMAFNWVDANEDDYKKPTLFQRFLNLFKRNE